MAIFYLTKEGAMEVKCQHDKAISHEDYLRFWKWMKTPLKDVPTTELVWCSQQDRQNSQQSLQNWKAEIERRDKLAADENLIL